MSAFPKLLLSFVVPFESFRFFIFGWGWGWGGRGGVLLSSWRAYWLRQKLFLFRGLPGLGFGVGLVISSFNSQFFLLACPFVSRVISFIYNVRVRGVASMFNETSHSFFVWVVHECLLPCKVDCIVCMDYVSHCSLTLLASPFSESVGFSLFSPSFSLCVLSSLSLVYWLFCTCLLACLIRAAILYFSSSAFVYIPMLCHR